MASFLPHGVTLRLLSVFVAVALIALGWSPSATADDVASAPSEAIAQALDRSDAPQPTADNDVAIPSSAEDDAVVETAAGEVTMSIPAVGEAEVDGPTALYEGAEEGISVALQPAAGGLRALVHIDSAQAPERYEFEMGGDVATLELMPDGSVVALNADDEVLAVAPEPWALDANGVSVPTHYEISGTTLTQIVEHKDGNFSYGIVADPWWNPFSWPWGKWVKASGKVIKKAGSMRKVYLKGGPYAYVGAAAAGCLVNNIPR